MSVIQRVKQAQARQIKSMGYETDFLDQKWRRDVAIQMANAFGSTNSEDLYDDLINLAAIVVTWAEALDARADKKD